MQFNRSALIEAIDQALKQERAATANVQARNAQSNAENRDEWLSLYSESWMKAANAIRNKIRKGQPVVEDDIPRDRAGYHGKAFYRPRRPEELPATRPELVGLRQVLTAVADDQISTTALRSLGVGVNTLRLLVPLLGAATVRSENLTNKKAGTP